MVVSSSIYGQSIVEVRSKDGRFELLRDGRPFAIRGVGGDTRLEDLVAYGGNAIRTWSAENLGAVLDEADRYGLVVCAGLWMGHPRHGFDYSDREAVGEQLREKLAHVRRHKDHPALLCWAVGNEAEGEGDDVAVWRAIEEVAEAIKRIDSNHPTMTVIAELGPDAKKARQIERHCPHIDIVGINAYGGIESVGGRYREAGTSKPYVITEHGPLGPWEVGQTPWGSPIERTSTEKAKLYEAGYRANVEGHPDRCLGTFAFLWGHKQETTATWFGMLLADGRRVGAVDAMAKCWTGKGPDNLCPRIESLTVDVDGRTKPGEVFEASVVAIDPEGDDLGFRWVLRSDAGTVGEGGDPQEAESAIEGAVDGTGNRVTVTMPEGGGGYRLFVDVDDGHGGAAVANQPLFVDAPIELKTVMLPVTLPMVLYGDDAELSVFAASGYMGNATAISMQPDCRDHPHNGPTCMKIDYDAEGAWGGVLWQSPPDDWEGLKPGGANLTGATHLEFWARGERGEEKVNFVFGVLDGNQPFRDTAKGELSDVTLGTTWQRFEFAVEGLDLRQIKTGFGWSVAGQGKPITFYLDEIRYVDRSSESPTR